MKKPLLNCLIANCPMMTDIIQPVLLLSFRFYIAYSFFMSGLVKIQSWSTTLLLFQNEYNVPFLSPELAAYLATIAELILPILLVLGSLTRLTTLALFIFNFVAIISYPDISAAGEWQHILWGNLLIVCFVFGAGKLSIDEVISRKWNLK